MQTLKLKSDLVETVRNGSKKSTVRLGVKNGISLGYGEFRNTDDPLDRIDIIITKVELTSYGGLTDEMARTGGYRSVKELREILMDIYGHINDHNLMTIIYFDIA